MTRALENPALQARQMYRLPPEFPMTVRHIVTRIEKLESRHRNGDEMLLLWRKPGQEVATALMAARKDGLYASGDLVLCVEWHGGTPPPQPRWCRLFPSDLTEIELDYCFRELKKFEGEASDAKLWHMCLGVEI
jgi:hypothetical protein